MIATLDPAALRRERVAAMLDASPAGMTLADLATALGWWTARTARTVAELSVELAIWEEDCPVGCDEAPCLHARLHLGPARDGRPWGDPL